MRHRAQPDPHCPSLVFSHCHDSHLSDPGGVVMSQFRGRRTSPHPSCAEACPSLNRKPCNCRALLEGRVDIETAEYSRHPSHRSGLPLLCLAGLLRVLTAIHRITTIVTCVSSGSERRALNTPTSSLSALSTKTANSPQSFNVYIATGDSDLWVASSACTTCNPDTTGFINASSSTLETAHDPTGQLVRVMLNYSTGVVAGDLVRDAVGMGGFLVPQQPWILVDQSPAGLLEGSAVGVMGLAFDTITSIVATPFWQTLAENGLLTTPEMSFWLARHLGDQNAQDEDFGGIFTLGGQNQTLYTGEVEFLPLVIHAGKRTRWLLNVSGTCLVCPHRVSAFLTDVP